jgi:hypothetical protein
MICLVPLCLYLVQKYEKNAVANDKCLCNLYRVYSFLNILESGKLGTGCKDTLVICNSIFFIFLNQIRAERDQKIIVWVEYFPYKYSFKVISND